MKTPGKIPLFEQLPEGPRATMTLRNYFYGDSAFGETSAAIAFHCAWRAAVRHGAPQALRSELRQSMRNYALRAAMFARRSSELNTALSLRFKPSPYTLPLPEGDLAIAMPCNGNCNAVPRCSQPPEGVQMKVFTFSPSFSPDLRHLQPAHSHG